MRLCCRDPFLSVHGSELEAFLAEAVNIHLHLGVLSTVNNSEPWSGTCPHGNVTPFLPVPCCSRRRFPSHPCSRPDIESYRPQTSSSANTSIHTWLQQLYSNGKTSHSHKTQVTSNRYLNGLALQPTSLTLSPQTQATWAVSRPSPVLSATHPVSFPHPMAPYQHYSSTMHSVHFFSPSPTFTPRRAVLVHLLLPAPDASDSVLLASSRIPQRRTTTGTTPGGAHTTQY